MRMGLTYELLPAAFSLVAARVEREYTVNMASIATNNAGATEGSGFAQWYNSQKNTPGDSSTIIPAVVIAEYLETMNFPKNESGIAIVNECLRQIGRKDGLKQPLEFDDLFIPEFRRAVNEIQYERNTGKPETMSDKGSASETSSEGRVDNPVKNVDNLPVAGTFSKYKRLKDGHDSWKNGKVPFTWSDIPGNVFNVRGPTYMTDGKKVSSSYSIFEPVAIEIFDANSPMDFPSNKFYIDKVPSKGNTNGVPNRLVVSLIFPNFPAENRLWGTKRTDGPSHHVIMWYELSEKAKHEYATKNDEQLSPALRLAKQYLSKGDPLHPHTKVIVRLANSEEVDLGIIANGLVYNYNAKPFLSNKSHQTRISDDCFEISLSVHTFGHAARTYYYEMHENFKNWVMDVAVVVEGREDNAQLPEQILACCRVVCPDPNKYKFKV